MLLRVQCVDSSLSAQWIVFSLLLPFSTACSSCLLAILFLQWLVSSLSVHLTELPLLVQLTGSFLCVFYVGAVWASLQLVLNLVSLVCFVGCCSPVRLAGLSYFLTVGLRVWPGQVVCCLSLSLSYLGLPCRECSLFSFSVSFSLSVCLLSLS